MYIEQNGINFELNKKALTAKIIHSENVKDTIVISDSITFESDEYIIKSIAEKSFKNSKVKLFVILENSYITSIAKETFAFSTIQQLFLPASIEKLEDGWCHETPDLISIMISLDNKNFQFYNNQILIGKNSKKDDKYEILYFANRNIEEITIPSNIKQIKPYSFENCHKLKYINFSKGSELKTVDSFSISKTNQLEEIDFSNSFVEELKKNWCQMTPKLKKIKISPKNKNFFSIGEKIIFGKSNEQSEFFNTLQFVSREIETVIIPSTIQYIYPSSLSKLSKIESIEINDKKYQLQLFFEQLPQNYQVIIQRIQDKVIKNIYSKFTFQYFKFGDQKESDKENVVFNLFFYLVNFKFITFSTSNENQIIIKQSNNINQSKTNVIFCVEDFCIIVEQMEISTFDNLISFLKKHDVSLFNVSKNEDEKEEIQSFCSEFYKEIKNNIFVKYTIRPIAGYLIHRFFYPTDFFIDKSFFIFDQENVSKENYLKQRLNDYLINELEYGPMNNNSQSLVTIADEINKGFYIKNDQRVFYEKDFIKLKIIYPKDSSIYYLAIYLPTLYIFMMEKFNDPNVETNEFKRKINLYNKPHRCLNKIYGILKENDNITGIIYEYMSNGNLYSYLTNHKLKETYFLLIMSRIFQGMDHLHSKCLIHRDLKPDNILIDHDGLPYISDYETVRSPSSADGDFTRNFGILPFAPPELINGGEVSYPSDIYSFGQIIKYLLEKQKKDEINIIQIKTILFQDLILKCIRDNPKTRIKRQVINAILNEIIISFFQFEEFLLDEKKKINRTEIINFIFENILTQKIKDKLEIYLTHIQSFQKLYPLKIMNNKSILFLSLGLIYMQAEFVQIDGLKAQEYFEKSAKYNNQDALIYLGDIYRDGYEVEQDYIKAREYYEKASKLNNSYALNNLGNLYENGLGVKQDYAKAKQYYERSSNLNNQFALYNIGNFYFYGKGVKIDYLIAKEYYEKASKLNNSDAFNNLGVIYEYGLGVKQDYLIARKYFEKAASLKNPKAFNNLANLYKNGKGVKQDYLKAKELYENAANLNSLTAFIELGNLYENGLGVKQDFSVAKEFYEKIARYKNSTAYFHLGNLYYYGRGVKQDFAIAKEYYEKSSNLNNSFALNNLGDLYENGYGVKQDYLIAKDLYEKAAKFGNSTALNNLGNLYEKGLGVKQDYLKAKEFYEKSTEYRNSNAFLYLGNLYKNGFGVKKDYLKAKEYYEKSSLFNNPAAFYKLGQFYENGFGVEQDFLLAKDYYEKSSELNHSKAHFYLGNLYSDGNICQINYKKAIKYYLKSIKIENGIIQIYNPITKLVSASFKTNYYRYISYNNLGLIYISVYEKVEKAEEYLKESAFAEYPYGQNNFGLLNQFYLNNTANAEYMYERSAKHGFALAEFNIGRMKEIECKFEESINLYIRASEHENNKLIYQNTKYKDKRLEISTKFIICFTNFKLVDYFLTMNKYEEAKKYFIKSINNLKNTGNNSIYPFKFIYANHNEFKNDGFMYLKKYVLNFPLFNLRNQPKLKLNQYSHLFDDKEFQIISIEIKKENSFTKEEEEEEETTNDEINMKDNDLNEKKKKVNNDHIKSAIKIIEEKITFQNLELPKNEANSKSEKIFEDPEILFDFIFNESILSDDSNSDLDLKQFFIKEIKEIIKIMENILYTKPYSILFGRISIEKSKAEFNERNNTKKNVDQSFFEGFGL